KNGKALIIGGRLPLPLPTRMLPGLASLKGHFGSLRAIWSVLGSLMLAPPTTKLNLCCRQGNMRLFACQQASTSKIMARAQPNHRKAKADTPEYAEVKQHMVNAAIELIAKNGFSKFRFEELAEKIGYNRATLYRYFDSKEDLMTEVMMTLMHEI